MWNTRNLPQPPIIKKKIQRQTLMKYCQGLGYSTPGDWVKELKQTLQHLSDDVSNESVIKSFNVETVFLEKSLLCRKDARNEKFFHLLKMAMKRAKRYQEYNLSNTASTLHTILVVPAPKETYETYRFPSPQLFLHLLLQMVRNYHLLQSIVELCEKTACWLDRKFSTGQRAALTLNFYAIAARLRSLCLYLQNSISTRYDKLRRLLSEIADKNGKFLTDAVPNALKLEEKINTSTEVHSDSILTMFKEETTVAATPCYEGGTETKKRLHEDNEDMGCIVERVPKKKKLTSATKEETKSNSSLKSLISKERKKLLKKKKKNL